jgi:phosphoglycerate dehydrogenase-like enzyme
MNLDLLPEDAIFINVGRGDLLSSDTLMHALNTNLLGAAIDVTDPEPLPTDHPLWSHPNLLITPHLSGDAEGEKEMATELLVGSIRRMESGGLAFNAVNVDKGY